MEKVIEKTGEKNQDLVLETEDGKKINLQELISEAAVAGMKEAGFPMGEDGKFSLKALPVEVQDEASKKLKGIEEAAEYVKRKVLPSDRLQEYGVKAIDSSSGSFGAVVPTELYNAILEQSKRWAVIRKYAFVFQMSGKLDLPQEGTLVTGYWVAENAPVTESDPIVGKTSFDDNGVAALIYIPWKLMRTSAQNIISFVSQLAGKAITDKEESAFVNGDGSGKPLGLRQTSGITAVPQAGSTFAYEDIVNLYFSLPVGYRQNAQFLTSAKGAQLLTTLKDENSRPLFTPGQPLDSLFNKPLVESEDIPADLGTGTDETEIWFGDLFNYWIKDGSELEMATQDKIENLQTKVVVYKFVDGRVVNKAAFRKLTGVK